MNKLYELGGDLRYIANQLDTIKHYNPAYKDLDEMSILKAIVFTEVARQSNDSYKVNKLFEIEDDEEYAVQLGNSYVCLNNDGTMRNSKYKGSIVSGKKLKQAKFNVHMAIDSGLLKLTKVSGGK